MGQTLSNWRILGAALLSGVLIAGAYLLARGIESPSLAQASMESELLQAIAAKDTDGDGLSDWEEALYGTSPSIADTSGLGMTDGEAVAKGLIVPKAIADIPAPASVETTLDENGLPPPPAEGTVTDAFTRHFLSIYASVKQAKGEKELSEADMQNIAAEAMDTFSSVVAAAADFKSAKDIVTSSSGASALAAYAAEVEAVFLKNAADAEKTEVVYLKEALENNNDAAFPPIASLAKSYRNTAVGLAALAVPSELAPSHLLLVNTLMRKSVIANDLLRVNTDPLAAILGLQQYPQVLKSLGAAFLGIGEVYAKANVRLSQGEPGAFIFSLIEGLAANQRQSPQL